MQAQADRMAERLRGGLQELLNRYEVPACVYGDASTFHVYFGARSIAGLDANSLKNIPPAIQNNFRKAAQIHGVDLMSRCSGVLSGVHTEADIDASLEGFDAAIKAMLAEDILRPSS
jgi:glutamate-1-semialdehyde 2,1-aminomutase